jgi:hypothetical protein
VALLVLFRYGSSGLLMILEIYTPAQIRACSKMLDRVFKAGKSLKDFQELAKYVTDNALEPMVTKMRLVFSVKSSDVVHRDDALRGIGWRNLRNWLKIKKLLDKVEITSEVVQTYVRQARKAELKLEESGYIRP